MCARGGEYSVNHVVTDWRSVHEVRRSARGEHAWQCGRALQEGAYAKCRLTCRNDCGSQHPSRWRCRHEVELCRQENVVHADSGFSKRSHVMSILSGALWRLRGRMRMRSGHPRCGRGKARCGPGQPRCRVGRTQLESGQLRYDPGQARRRRPGPLRLRIARIAGRPPKSGSGHARCTSGRRRCGRGRR